MTVSYHNISNSDSVMYSASLLYNILSGGGKCLYFNKLAYYFYSLLASILVCAKLYSLLSFQHNLAFAGNSVSCCKTLSAYSRFRGFMRFFCAYSSVGIAPLCIPPIIFLK